MVNPWFCRMKRARTDFKEYMDAFDDELKAFKIRVKGRAEARIEKAMKEAEEVCCFLEGRWRRVGFVAGVGFRFLSHAKW